MTAIRNCKRSLRHSCLLFCTLLGSGVAFGDRSIDWSDLPDFDSLRKERGSRADFVDSCGIYGQVDSNDATASYLNEEKWEAVISSAGARLETCPIDIRFHIYMAIAFQKLGRESESEIHIAWSQGLIDSILRSGDGLTADSAFVTISIAEEYEFLSAARLTPTDQSLTPDGRDRFEVTDEEGTEHVIYFFPELHWARLADMFPQ
jgi:hypothetical protein